MDGPPAPEAVLKLMSCTCVRVCREPKCPCLANGLKCTDLCKLQTCDNQARIDESDSDSPVLSETSDEDEE